MQTLHECDLSVIVPVYNLERWISPLLESLKSQWLGVYEVEYIFVLNCCTDKSEEIIRESGLPCDIYLSDIQGCGEARNTALDVAKGKYVWFIDGDDWLLSETAIKECLDRMYKDDLDILRVPFTSNSYHMNYFSMVWQYLFKREFIEEFRFPNIQPHEDDAYMEMVLRKKGLNAGNFMSLPSMPKPLYHYNYLREGSNMYRHYRGEKLL